MDSIETQKVARTQFNVIHNIGICVCTYMAAYYLLLYTAVGDYSGS